MTDDDIADMADRHHQEQRWTCQFPGECCMQGLHHADECHTAEMVEDYERAMAEDPGPPPPPMGPFKPSDGIDFSKYLKRNTGAPCPTRPPPPRMRRRTRR